VTSLSEQLLELQNQNAYRVRQTVETPQGVKITVNGQPYISFCSNDYLGLANDPRVCEVTKKAIDQYGVGTGASQLISGYTNAHKELEQHLADFFSYPRCVLFSSGFLANLGVISSLAKKNTTVIEDKLNHASLIDAAKYAGAKLKRYKHCDSDHAKEILASLNSDDCLIASDGVFSMEGSIAPIKQLASIKNNNTLIIDDAHGIGVLGKHGRGSLEYHNISSSHVDILIGTFGKSFGVSGAFVLGNNEMIEYLIQKARTLIYTTAAPAALAIAASKSLKIIISESERRDRLHDNISYFRKCAHQASLDLLASNTAIQSLVIGDNITTVQVSNKLKQNGLLTLAIRPPTVPKNTARLRITLTSEHSHRHIDMLISSLAQIVKSIT